MSNKEWQKSQLSIDNFSGGSDIARTYEIGGKVISTEFGVFSCTLSNEGFLFADFTDNGLLCVYDDEGDLDMVSIDLENYLFSFSQNKLNSMPKFGADIVAMAKWLKETGMMIVLSVDVKQGIVEITNFNPDGEEFSNVKSRSFDLDKGLDGDAKIGAITLPFRVERNGDELVLGMGEQFKGKILLDMVAVSSEVDFIEDFLAGANRDMSKLMRKIRIV